MRHRSSATEAPLVAVLCSAPILGEAVSAALEGIADVAYFPARMKDPAGLVRALAPSGVVVDSEVDARAVAGLASTSGFALVHVALRDRRLRVHRAGLWEERDDDGLSPAAIRNALVGGIFDRDVKR